MYKSLLQTGLLKNNQIHGCVHIGAFKSVEVLQSYKIIIGYSLRFRARNDCKNDLLWAVNKCFNKASLTTLYDMWSWL
jgi:hypothetical protein